MLDEKKLKIAIDYDDTFTALKSAISTFMGLLLIAGHEVKFVTFRCDEGDNQDIIDDAYDLGVDIIYTCGKQKQHCYNADIWMDDSPDVIPSYEKLQVAIGGCEHVEDFKSIIIRPVA